jgi:hypothetical protein
MDEPCDRKSFRHRPAFSGSEMGERAVRRRRGRWGVPSVASLAMWPSASGSRVVDDLRPTFGKRIGATIDLASGQM